MILMVNVLSNNGMEVGYIYVFIMLLVIIEN